MAPGSGGGRKGKCGERPKCLEDGKRWVGGERCIVFDMHEVETSVAAGLAWSLQA